jgi:hypothetical protein
VEGGEPAFARSYAAYRFKIYEEAARMAAMEEALLAGSRPEPAASLGTLGALLRRQIHQTSDLSLPNPREHGAMAKGDGDEPTGWRLDSTTRRIGRSHTSGAPAARMAATFEGMEEALLAGSRPEPAARNATLPLETRGAASLASASM